MSKILVVGDDNPVGRVLDELIRAGFVVKWARHLADATEFLQEDFETIVICPENGLANADELAAELKLIAENMPIVIVIREGVTDNGVGAGIGLGRIDAIIPDCTAAMIMDAIDLVAMQGKRP